ncbi:MAG: hypothetical protein LBC02_06220 [Planctomycetaceae bacterium]|jgi:predicted nucleic acid-binding Zn ribbon protein|nr:hypothetical protein [Planctomycetaceae bacterium]
MRIINVLFLFFLINQLVFASDPRAIALLKGVEQERLKYECFRICYTEHREEEGKTVEQIVEFDHGKIRKEHLKTDQFQGMKSIFLGDFLYIMTSYDAKSVNLVTSKSINASGADTYDPRMIGLTDVMTQTTSVTDCLLYTRRKNFSTQITELNGKKVHSVVCDDGDDHWEFFIEEPGFRILKQTFESPYIDIQIDAEYSNPKVFPFPSQVKILRKEGKEKKVVRFNRTITVTNFEEKKSFPPETFTLASLNLPINATVMDYRINRTIGYWDGEKLVDAPVRISAQERQEIEEKLQEQQQHTKIVRYVMITIGVLLIILSIVLKIRKRFE